jgi:hypothetical protein
MPIISRKEVICGYSFEEISFSGHAARPDQNRLNINEFKLVNTNWRAAAKSAERRDFSICEAMAICLPFFLDKCKEVIIIAAC